MKKKLLPIIIVVLVAIIVATTLIVLSIKNKNNKDNKIIDDDNKNYEIVGTEKIRQYDSHIKVVFLLFIFCNIVMENSKIIGGLLI